MSRHTDLTPATPSPYKSSPGTPKGQSKDFPSPIDPPQRRSSLAFSQLLTGTPAKSVSEESTRTPNVGRKRTHITLFMRPAPTPGHTSRIQQIFQDATAMTQLDMAYASSPVGSIDSRLSPSSATTPRHTVPPTSPDIMNWRYSTAPQCLAEVESDVREPFPTVEPDNRGCLPPLPDSSSPASSGSASEVHLPLLPESQNNGEVCQSASTDLDRSLSELHVSHIPSASSSYYDVSMLDEFPDHSADLSKELDIFCSPVARAAADSAKLKRIVHPPGHTEIRKGHDHPLYCPDPSVHQHIYQPKVPVPGPYCPDMSVHRYVQHANGLAVPRPHTYRRANSRGSPLPPLKGSFAAPHQHYQSSPLRSSHERPFVSNQPQHQAYVPPPPIAEHFQPGWSNFPVQADSHGPYSFSTEAAKITGSSVAPETRILDSYRTDTLTPLAKPKARYKKTGIAAMTRGVGRYYGVHFGHSSRPVHFGSSPPRATQENPRKRLSDPEHHGAEHAIVEVDVEDVLERSPDVTPYRKGREPKRPRRSSYWDRDILGTENKENESVVAEELFKNPERAGLESEMLLDEDDQ